LVLLISGVFIWNHSFVNRLKLVCFALRSQLSSPWIKSSFIVWRLKTKLLVSIWTSELIRKVIKRIIFMWREQGIKIIFYNHRIAIKMMRKKVASSWNWNEFFSSELQVIIDTCIINRYISLTNMCVHWLHYGFIKLIIVLTKTYIIKIVKYIFGSFGKMCFWFL
jgi:hypothetical protein